MTYLLSEPIEQLIADRSCEQFAHECDVLVVGSGYGGAIAAARLAGLKPAGQPITVLVFERGSEHALGEFPESLGELPGHVQIMRPDRTTPIGNADALFDFRVGDSLSVLVASGLGGGSLINGNVALEPDDEVFRDPRWPGGLRNRKSELDEGFAAIRDLLGVEDAPVARYPKYKALDRLARSLGATCKPAPITVTQRDGVNNVGIEQKACIGCANCVTGCNVGAKNTLTWNALPLARSRGASLYTGATVLSLAPDGSADGSTGWLVRFRRTASAKTVLRDETFTLRVRKAVILAAGTLGSTEILLRSQALSAGGLKFSQQLGSRFSVNGDVIASGYAQRDCVNAVAHADIAADPGSRDQYGIGPTIVGYFEAVTGSSVGDDGAPRRRKVTIEDGAVPSALAHLFGEIVVTGSLPQRYVTFDQPGWFPSGGNQHKDPLAVHPGALQHTQVLLGMGDDGSRWRLDLRYPEDDESKVDHDGARIRMVTRQQSGEPDVSPSSGTFNAIDRLFAEGASNGGFDGGDYVPNPLWKLMPDEMADLSSAPAPGQQLLAVHPLGGCPMGDDAASGVVNEFGGVFLADAVQAQGATYEGLYVMDGAIVPCALGVNPFLTIAALAWRCVEHACRHVFNTAPSGLGKVENPEIKKKLQQTLAAPPPPVPAHQVSVTFCEQLMGRLDMEGTPQWLFDYFDADQGKQVAQLSKRRGLVIRAQIEIKDVHSWLRDTQQPLPATAQLFANPIDTDSVPFEHLLGGQLAAGAGQVRLLARDGPCRLRDIVRALAALRALCRRRGMGDAAGSLSGAISRTSLWKVIRGFWDTARNHARWRYLHYSFDLKASHGSFTISGSKELAYAPCKRNPWMALVELPITLKQQCGLGMIEGLLQVDLVELTRASPLQVRAAPDTPTALSAVASIGAMFVRALFQTHFWSFGAPDYPEKSPVGNRDPRPIRLRDGTSISPEIHPFSVPRSDPGAAHEIDLRLVRYRKDNAESGSILLVPGFAVSSLVFATDTIRHNMAAHFFERGYDVWLLDYRLSIALADRNGMPLAEMQTTMDEIADNDIPTAIRRVYENSGRQPIQVFAHCVGAGVTGLAILNGKCNDGGRSMVSALALHAVYPWVVPSIANRLRANVAAFLKDAIAWKTLDSVPPEKSTVTAFDGLFDRLAGSLPWTPEEYGPHRRDTDRHGMGKQVCDRLTLVYGYQWQHGNLTAATHERAADLFGTANLETFRQLFFISLRKRLTSRDGTNCVLDTRFKKNWTFPTLFAHGAESGVYNPLSAVRSYLRLRELREVANMGSGRNRDLYWLEVPDCGHMDMLFGQYSDANFYPYLEAFFHHARTREWRDQAAAERLSRIPDSCRDPHQRPTGTPICGPIIGWVRTEGDRIKLRILIEPSAHTTTPPRRPATSEGVKVSPCPLPGIVHLYPGIYLPFDVSVPGDFAEDLAVSVDYGPGSIDYGGTVEFKATPATAAKAPAQTVIPLTRLPWFKRLKAERERAKRNEPRDSSAFLVGSCRYSGSPFDANLADDLFGAMNKHVTDKQTGVDHVLLVGDQIYADATADIFDTYELRERYAKQYREAFGAAHLRELLSIAPTYFAIDDHEFEDNWPGNASDLARPGNHADAYMKRFRHAKRAVMAYQWSTSQRDGWKHRGLWHTFDSAGLPFFVMDTRTERTLRQASVTRREAQLVGPQQLDALMKWLSDAPADMPKFIVSGSVLAPVERRFVGQSCLYRENDGWAGYPATWRALVQHIVSEEIANVIFIAGDAHLSAVTRMRLSSEGKEITAYQIMASSVFAPLPFANAEPLDYDWAVPTALPFSDAAATLEATPYRITTHSSHFLRVDAQRSGTGPWKMIVGAYDSGNQVVKPEGSIGPPFSNINGVVHWTLG